MSGIHFRVREMSRKRYDQQYFLFEILRGDNPNKPAVKITNGSVILQPVRGNPKKFCSQLTYQRNCLRSNMNMSQELIEEMFRFSEELESNEYLKKQWETNGNIEPQPIFKEFGYTYNLEIWLKEIY